MVTDTYVLRIHVAYEYTIIGYIVCISTEVVVIMIGTTKYVVYRLLYQDRLIYTYILTGMCTNRQCMLVILDTHSIVYLLVMYMWLHTCIQVQAIILRIPIGIFRCNGISIIYWASKGFAIHLYMYRCIKIFVTRIYNYTYTIYKYELSHINHAVITDVICPYNINIYMYVMEIYIRMQDIYTQCIVVRIQYVIYIVYGLYLIITS